ncbi:hypothetical protein D8I24_5679 [Cupriavidus necator H850]|uniref:hypothetical protein n=1 Tax=Cupriavidus necator TaxID=106590 RepID=UPI00129EDE3E|nr:hypothetical protein [Cupriavidus necator]KAI3598733.1 hypothetical protein D8I24_5679 [Cupriavidus necator H850]
MKRLFATLLFALAAVASAATLSPVQLLNPAGSVAGQAIISSGPSTPPAWASLSAASLAPIAANSVVANKTGLSAAPTAAAVPSCSAANSALIWTSGTGFGCGTTFALTGGNLSQFAATTSAQLAGVLSDETGSGSVVFGTSPTITTPNIVGTSTNNSASAGSVGEFVTATGTAVSLTSGASANVTSISLTAGDWDVQGNIVFNAAGSTVVSLVNAGVSTTSATLPASPFYSMFLGVNLAAGAAPSSMAPVQRISVASTTTVYLVGTAVFSTSTCTATGFIRARRVR